MTYQKAVYFLAHAGWGAALTFAFALWLPVILAAALAAIIAIGKESIESVFGGWEPVQPWHSAVVDVAQFMWGIAGAVILLLIRGQ